MPCALESHGMEVDSINRGQDGYQHAHPDEFDLDEDSFGGSCKGLNTSELSLLMDDRCQAISGDRHQRCEGDSAPCSVPLLSFGEQLVLETYMRCRQRPYDRKRQEQLAQPKRVRQADNIGLANTGTADKTQIASIVSRLTQPKSQKATALVGAPTPGETLVIQHDVKRRRDVDMAAVVNRLSTPKPPRPPEVSACTMGSAASRPVDISRLHTLAQPSKRGASCRSWGVHPDWTRDVSSAATTPRSARSADGISSTGLRQAGGCIAGGWHQQQTSPHVQPQHSRQGQSRQEQQRQHRHQQSEQPGEQQHLSELSPQPDTGLQWQHERQPRQHQQGLLHNASQPQQQQQHQPQEHRPAVEPHPAERHHTDDCSNKAPHRGFKYALSDDLTASAHPAALGQAAASRTSTPNTDDGMAAPAAPVNRFMPCPGSMDPPDSPQGLARQSDAGGFMDDDRDGCRPDQFSDALHQRGMSGNHSVRRARAAGSPVAHSHRSPEEESYDDGAPREGSVGMPADGKEGSLVGSSHLGIADGLAPRARTERTDADSPDSGQVCQESLDPSSGSRGRVRAPIAGTSDTYPAVSDDFSVQADARGREATSPEEPESSASPHAARRAGGDARAVGSRASDGDRGGGGASGPFRSLAVQDGADISLACDDDPCQTWGDTFGEGRGLSPDHAAAPDGDLSFPALDADALDIFSGLHSFEGRHEGFTNGAANGSSSRPRRR
mmetsp:Transcript_76076/g.219693  ORF Transcript_76076/g.219693 Transcript_76076/m.219693 type:complete len:724 (+) Transcript_76076:115-2286(+)